MENKKLGILLVIFSFVFVMFLLYFNNSLSQSFGDTGCAISEACIKIDNSLTFVHFGFGFFGFMLGLGFYLLIFNKTDERIMRRLEEEKNTRIDEERFDILLKALDPFEKKVMKAVREQEGITQNTLRLRTDMSKAKLSYVVNELERRGLIKRVKSSKTFAIHLSKNI